jgi:hypothetical protein
MVLRNHPPFNGKRYIGNSSPDKMEVHDLILEDEKENGFQIDEIKNVVTFDSLAETHSKDYDNCDKCLDRSTR